MGTLEVVCGPMFSGKSEELIRRVTRTVIAKRPVWVFKPAIDERYAEEEVVSHAGMRLKAIPVDTIADIRARLDADEAWTSRPGTVAIDELQFFAPSLDDTEVIHETIELLRDLIQTRHRTVVSGLDLDFRGEPFGVLPLAMALAQSVDKLTAVCHQCGDSAVRSQRLIDGKAAPHDAPVVLIGGTEAYEARCIEHWDDGRT